MSEFKVQARPFRRSRSPELWGETAALDSLEGGSGEGMFEQVVTEASELIGW